MDPLDQQIAAMTEMFTTGTPPGKPDEPHIPTYIVGTVVTNTSLNFLGVSFPTANGGTQTITCPVLQTGRPYQVGDVVLTQQFPNQRLVLGALTAYNTGLPDMSTFVRVTGTGGSIPASAWTRVTGFSFADGNSALFSAANQWYTTPRSGRYLIMGRFRVADAQTAGTNFGIAMETADSPPTEDHTSWGMIPSTGTSRRYTAFFQTMETFGAGVNIRMIAYSDGAATTASIRSFSIVGIGGPGNA